MSDEIANLRKVNEELLDALKEVASGDYTSKGCGLIAKEAIRLSASPESDIEQLRRQA